MMSHLHKDHAGGVSVKNPSGERFISFPYATWYVQKREFEFATGAGTLLISPKISGCWKISAA
jgi:glyoxylase-like metal-dependent hydrolase (beta-lactamase superfamily II)